MQRGITRTGDPVDDLFEFVLTEKGRVAPALEKVGAIVIYANDKELDEIVQAFQAVYPNALVRAVK